MPVCGLFSDDEELYRPETIKLMTQRNVKLGGKCLGLGEIRRYTVSTASSMR